MGNTYSACVKEYRETCWTPDYAPKDTDRQTLGASMVVHRAKGY